MDEPQITTTKWATSGSTQWGPITAEMREIFRRSAAAAVERARTYGFDDRRETAWGLLLAPVAPLLGLIFLGWSNGDALSVLLLNLLVGLLDDVAKVLRAGGSWTAMRLDAVRDAFVWRLTSALKAGRNRLHVTSLPRPIDFTHGYPMDLFWLSLAGAFAVAGFCLLMLNGPGSLHAGGTGIYAGVVPNLVLSIALGRSHRRHQHPHWRKAGSVRLRSTTANACFVAAVAGYPFALLGAETVPEARTTLDAATLLPLMATLLWGGYKLLELSSLRRSAAWLAAQAARDAAAERKDPIENRAKIS